MPGLAAGIEDQAILVGVAATVTVFLIVPVLGRVDAKTIGLLPHVVIQPIVVRRDTLGELDQPINIGGTFCQRFLLPVRIGGIFNR